MSSSSSHPDLSLPSPLLSFITGVAEWGRERGRIIDNSSSPSIPLESLLLNLLTNATTPYKPPHCHTDGIPSHPKPSQTIPSRAMSPQHKSRAHRPALVLTMNLSILLLLLSTSPTAHGRSVDSSLRGLKGPPAALSGERVPHRDNDGWNQVSEEWMDSELRLLRLMLEGRTTKNHSFVGFDGSQNMGIFGF